MIQRLQTVYFIAIIIICGVSCGGELVSSHQMIPTGATAQLFLVRVQAGSEVLTRRVVMP